MNRVDLQKLAEMRIDEAAALLAAGKYAGAYYLAGYAVECALKACIARKTKEHDYPDKDFATKVYTHKIEELLKHAGLKATLDTAKATEPVLDVNAAIVVAWNEAARYELGKTQVEAEDLYKAITDAAHGVRPWIQSHW